MPEDSMLRELVQYEVREQAAWITFNRPEKLNAVTFSMTERMVELLHDAENDDGVRAIVLTGSGDNFTVGADLNEPFTIYQEREGQTDRRPSQRTRLRFDRNEIADRVAAVQFSTKPVIVRAKGYALGMGAFWIAAADMAIVSDDAQVGMPEEKIGFSGANPVLISLILSMGLKRARDFLLFGKTVTGREAADLGLVTRSVPVAELDDVVSESLAAISRIPKDGLAMGRFALNMAYEHLGMHQQFTNWTVLHTLFTNLRFESGEYNMLSARSKGGVRAAIKERDGNTQ